MVEKKKLSSIQNWEPVRDPIYDYIRYNEELEENVIDTLPMQRLRILHQLQTAYFVYPGADHSRFQHSLGVMHLAGEFATHLIRDTKKISQDEKQKLIEAVRIGGLLHDVGHGPFSHAFDTATIKPNQTLKKEKIYSHEDISYLLVEKGKIGNILEEWDIKDLVLGLLCPSRLSPMLKPILRALRQTIHHSIYPSDILDFIRRDGYFCGTKEYGTIDFLRLILSSKLVDSEIALQERAIECLKAFMMSRIQMFRNVYFHRTCRAIDHILSDMLRNASDQLGLVQRVLACKKGEFGDYLELNDATLLFLVKTSCKGDAVSLAEMILERKNPWRSLADYEYHITDPKAAVTLRISEDKLIENIAKAFLSEITRIDPKISFFIDSSSIPTFPDSPHQMIYTNYPILDREGKLQRYPMTKLIEEYKTLFSCTFRIYVTEKAREKYPELKSIAETTLRNIFEGVPSFEESM